MGKAKKILITGSNGFVGKAMYYDLISKGYEVRGSIRNPSKSVLGQDNIVVGQLSGSTDWKDALTDCDTVVHLAGRAHVLSDSVRDSIVAFQTVNTLATINLANQSAECGVRRFIFLSSIGVNGAKTYEEPFTADSVPNPHSPYAVSKLEAEVGLREIAAKTQLQLVIIRPPAIYGKNAPGNFGLIEKSINRAIPLPLKSIDNRRSLINLYNLTGFIALCIEHEKVANELFVIDDNQDLSTPEIVSLVAALMGAEAKMFRCPKSILRLLFKILGKNKSAESLIGNLQVDSSHARNLTGWLPQFSPKDIISKSIKN